MRVDSIKNRSLRFMLHKETPLAGAKDLCSGYVRGRAVSRAVSRDSVDDSNGFVTYCRAKMTSVSDPYMKSDISRCQKNSHKTA